MLPLDAAVGSLAWMSRGACHGTDPEIFFPIAATGPAMPQIGEAKAVCRRCAVRELCLSYALATGQDGIWGGTTTEERVPLRESSVRRARGRVAHQIALRQTHGQAMSARHAEVRGALPLHDDGPLLAGPAENRGLGARPLASDG